MKKNSLRKIFLFILLSISTVLSDHDLNKINLQLSWFNQFQFAGYYMAKEKGFYEEENIDINIKPFNWGIDVPKEVSLGKVDFGIGRETLILEKINNYHNLVSLFPLFQVSPLILLSKKESNINTISDFENKSFMATIDDANEVSIKAMLKSYNIDFSKIKFQKHTHNINDLISGKTDIISAYSSKSPYILEKNKIEYNIFSPKDHGFDMYNDFLFTNQELIDKNIFLVEAFKRASLKGWEYAYNNIEESIDLILKKYNTQNLTRNELVFEANELKKLSYYKGSLLGEVDPNKLTRILDLYRLMGVTNQLNINTFKDFLFTNNNKSLTKEENTYLNKKKILKMCIKQNHMPYEKMENNSFKGIVSEYKKLFEKKLHMPIKIVLAKDRKETIDFLKSNKCDMISFVGNIAQRDKILNFSIPYIKLPYVAVSKKHTEFISSFSQLSNKKVLTSECRVLNKKMEHDYPFIDKEVFKDFRTAFLEIEKNNADFFIANIAEIVYSFKDYFSSEIHIAGRLNSEAKLSFALNKEDNTLLKILNKTILNITDLEHDEVLSEFINLRYKEVVDYSVIWKVLLVSVLIILLLMFFYFRESKLKNKILKLNNTLEDRVKDEVKKNREKDEYLFRQSKLASMGEMIGNIAHQWRQPLNRISLSSQVIDTLVEDNNPENNEIIKRKIDHINKNIHYMSDTIEDFMNYFHPNKEKKKFYFISVFDKVLELIKSRTKNIEINIDINKDISINGYENEFTQIILVILENAVDAFENNQKNNQKINIKVNDVHTYYSLTITDNAGGIPIEIIDKIFEPYFTTKFKKEGSGIGLYMAKIIIEQSMNGSIEVNSYNEITNFKIRLYKD